MVLVLKQGTPLQGGKYIIRRVLGQGGFGITYLAEQVSLGREVAIKEFFMKDNCSRDESTSEVFIPTTGNAAQVEQYRKKFMKEARILASLDHPHIVNVIDVWEENGTVYYSMPYMSGGSLRDYVSTHGRMPEQKALRYVGQIASALKYMHEKKHLCHYDIKPANILTDSYDNAILIDFGISKNYDSNGNETSSTPVGMSEGFAPLEQYQQMVNEFSPASDVYALGATLFYLLMGKVPPSAISLVQGEELQFDTTISDTIKQVVMSAVVPAVKKRLQSVDGFINLKISDYDDKTTKVHESTSISPRPNSPEESHEETQMVGRERPVIDNTIIQELLDDMVLVKGGTFMMGHKNIIGSGTHQITLHDYYICRYQVTQNLWQTIMGSNPSYFNTAPRLPVERVSWEDCQRFISKLNQMSNKWFRLPTEAEWEFAARGGNNSKGYKYSGSNAINEVAWYDGNSSGKTHLVGMKAPNELGLYDMSGNVWEWCQDWYGNHIKEAQINPAGAPSGRYRVSRGGGWCGLAGNCKVYRRGGYDPTSQNVFLGLRLACTSLD